MDRIPALRIMQQGGGEEAGGGVTLYVAAMTLRQLRNHAKTDTWTPSNANGYQRPIVDRRLRELARYVQEQEGVLPTSILVGTRPDDHPHIRLTGFDGGPAVSLDEVVLTDESPLADFDGGHAVSLGELEMPDESPLWVIDGQHRYNGLNYAYERGDERLADYPFPVCIMWDVDQYQEMVHFNIINTRQKKMSTDIVDRHLVQIQEKRGLQMVATGARGEKEYMRATATKVVDMLNEATGVWHHQIAIPGVPGRDQGLVRQHAMVVSIEPFLRDPWVKGLSEVDKVKVLTNFWDAAREVWPDAFESPGDYRVQATVGVYSLHMALPVIIHRCLEGRDLTKDRMCKLIEDTDITAEFWHKEDGAQLTLGTGMASIRALAQYIIEKLPSSAPGAVRL